MEKTCDFCAKDIEGNWIDGKTIHGPWATMCASCHRKHGVGFGLGKGQEFTPEGVKVRG